MVFLNLSVNLLLLLLKWRSAEHRPENWEFSLGSATSSQSAVGMHLYLSGPRALPFGRWARLCPEEVE